MANITVAGGLNIDIVSRSGQPLVACDSNPGVVRMSLGGVGRNIAENLSRLGHRVTLLTALGEDANAAFALSGCEAAHIDLSHALRVPGGRCSSYVAIHDQQGEMRLAVADMEICAALTPAYFEPLLPLLNASDAVVLDANLPEESLLYIARHVRAPLFADTVSTAKAPRMAGVLPYLHTLQLNRMEAQLLTGLDIQTPAQAGPALSALRRRGASRVLLTLGASGAAYADARCTGLLPCPGVPPQCTTGCGDAFLAAALHAFLAGADTRGMARFGLIAASFCAQCDSAVHPELSAARLEAYARLLPDGA